MIKKAWLSVALLGGMFVASSASAGLIVDTVVQNQAVSTLQTHSYTHNLNDDNFVLGSAISAILEINIFDDTDFLGLAGELAIITVEDFDFDTGGVWGTIFGSAPAGWDNEVQFEALFSLNEDGFLDVAVTSLFGDFRVGNSVLTVTTQDEVPVPEPMTLSLLGLSLLGIAGAQRRRKAKA